MEPQLEIDGVRAVIVWLEGRPIAVVNGWDIATGRGWIKKAEDWARKHHALLYDTEGGFDEPVLPAFCTGLRHRGRPGIQGSRLTARQRSRFSHFL
jgi:hypothetical protein